MPSVSVIIPTRNEPAIDKLISQILPYGYEVVVVDDSNEGDDTPVKATKAGARVIKGHSKGLAQAVLDGIAQTESDLIIVCDGDGQHPPHLLPQVADKLDRYDLVVVTKHKHGAKDKMSASRKLQSTLGVLAAQKLIPAPVSDPMSGFFGVRRKCLDGVELEAIGFKIGLEIIVKAKWVSHYELPMEFGVREAGMSKGTRNALQKHLYHLFQWHLENKVELPKGAEEYFNFYEADDWQKDWKQSIALVLQHITKDIYNERGCNVLLDCGCGSSPNINYMWGEKYGVEVRPEAIEFMRQHSSSVFSQGSVLQIPFKDEKFDTAVCVEVLEHLRDAQVNQALTELTRVTKKGGYVVLATPNYASPLWNAIETAQKYLQPKQWTSDHYTKFTRKSLNSLCYQYGLQEVRYDGVQANMDMVITYKKES